MFKIESYFGPLLMSYLNKYVKLEEESFKLSLWGGDVTFHNLELQYDILEDLMPLPIGFKSGQVHELNVHVPWTKLGSESVVITLNTVECILALKSDFAHKSKEDIAPNSGAKQKLERNIPPGYLKSYLVNIINNIQVKVNNLIIKFVEDDIVLSMNAKSLEYLTVTSDWTRGFIDFSSGNLLVHKIVQVSDLTVCLDQMDANGHIEVYQEPILYRCSVECRFILRYQSFISNKPDFLKFNIKFGNLELNVTTSQMPMMRRLVELFYALYYNNINWDTVVGCLFSNQINKPPETIKKPDKEVVVETEGEVAETSSWGSWAWSYVPSVFVYDDGLSEEESVIEDIRQGTATTTKQKKTLIFGIYLDSLQINLKKSQSIKSPYGSQRVGRTQRTILFVTLKGNNIGLNVTSSGIGFFNVQLGSTNIYLANTGGICPCGQLYKVDNHNKIYDSNKKTDSLLLMGSPVLKTDVDDDFYLTGSLFSTKQEDNDNVKNVLNKLSSICSQETYAALFPQERCLNMFGAIWFDYVYCMQIVKNDMDESEIDPSNLCNTDGIRESSIVNLYLGASTCNVNSFFVHNLIEITNALDISRYSSYFRASNNGELTSITEVSTVLPIIELRTNLVKFSKVIPMYPIILIECVSVLSTFLLKESKDLLNKCYVSKELEIIGLSMSLLVQQVVTDAAELADFIKWTIIKPWDISFTHRSLLYSESWKTSQFVNDEKLLKISNIQFEMIPSHVKAAFVIVASNYSWIVKYFEILQLPTSLTSMNRQLDDVTLKMLDPNSSLLQACFKNCYLGQTYELHVSLPNIMFRFWKTHTSYFIDAKISHETLFAYLKDPISLKIIPILDNKVDNVISPNPSFSNPFCLLYCQIPTQTRPVNCTFSFHCQIGSINCMFSSQLISWFTFPVLDFDLDDCFRAHSYVPSTKSREGTIVSSIKLGGETRTTADGNSRPQSPSILVNACPVPGHPRSVPTVDTPVKKDMVVFTADGSGWWNLFKNGCSKYFFFLQSLDVCIKLKKSRFYVMTVVETCAFQSNINSCNQWLEQFTGNNQSSIFLITVTRLALINSHNKEYLDDHFEKIIDSGTDFHQKKSATFIESLPWELIFHDIQIDCIYSKVVNPQKLQLFYDSILKPVSINCTLSATPKCSSPERLDTLYSISWGIHVDITEVHPTLKQIYLIKLLDFFVTVVLNVSCREFTEKHYQLLSSHYYIVKNTLNRISPDSKPVIRSKQSVSTKSTIKSASLSSTTEHKVVSSSYRVVSCSKLESTSVGDSDVGFKLSFWVQCTLSQFQFIILLNDNNDNEEESDVKEKNVCLVMQVDDVTGSIDIQEKFVEIKSKFGSIFCELGEMKDNEIISQNPILKSGSKFLSNTSIVSKSKDDRIDDLQLDSGNRHCLSAAIIRTTVNNLSQRPLSTYHHFKDTDSFKSYPTEFTGNFSCPHDPTVSNQAFVTQISSIIEPFELIISSYFVEQCHKLIDTLLSIYLQFFHNKDQKYGYPDKIKMSAIKQEPYFISEDMPKFHLLIKSSKIIMPCNTNQTHSKDCGNNCIILSWNKISLQPFSDNPICRPGLTDDSTDDENINIKCDSTVDSLESEQKPVNSLDDNRQFQLNIVNFGIYSAFFAVHREDNLRNKIMYDISLSKSSRYSDPFIASTIHGQNPAFEWNNYSKMPKLFHSKKLSDGQLKAILKPIDIQIIFAGALYQYSDNVLQRTLCGGYGLEINILTSVEFLIDLVTINSVNSVVANLNQLFSYENIKITERCSDLPITTVNHCIEDWIAEKKLGHLVPCVPVNILVTTRKIQMLLFLQDTLLSVHGICVSISQPHALLYFKNKLSDKLELSLFDIAVSVTPTTWSESVNFFDKHDQSNDWTNNLSFILAEMRTVLKTQPGNLDVKTGVPKSFLTATFTDFYDQSRSSNLKVNFARQTLVDIDINDIKQMVGLVTLLCPSRLRQRRDSPDPVPSSGLICTPRYFILNAEFVFVKLGDCRLRESCFELKFGKSAITITTLKNYTMKNLRSMIQFQCDSVLLAYNSEKEPTLVLKPCELKGKCQFQKYRADAADRYWISSECFGEINCSTVNLSIDKYQLVLIRNLIQDTIDCLQPMMSCTSLSEPINNRQAERRVEMFYDDLRSERFEIHTKLNSDSSTNDLLPLIADDATVMFSNDGEDLASMYWTYPEARFITGIEVKPVPFVFIEYKLTKDDNYEQLQVPCQLEYWNWSNNCYELYKRFHLSENQVERVYDFPQLNQAAVSAKSWRVVFDCYARYKKVDDANEISYSEKAMLVYLSPLVLAASMNVESCYAPSVVQNSFLSVVTPSIQIEFHDREQEEITKDKLCKPLNPASGYAEHCSIIESDLLFTIRFYDCTIRYLLIGKVRSHISQAELYVASPFVALNHLILHVDDVNIHGDGTSIQFDVGTIQAGVEQSNLRQIITITENMIELIGSLLLDQPIVKSNYNCERILFCNLLDRRIRLRQHLDSFYNIADSSKLGGIGSGEAVVLKFLPANYYKYHKKKSEPILYEPIKLVLGLCSELKGTVRWIEPIEMPYLGYDEITSSTSTLRNLNVDCANSLNTPICSNSSNLSNSFNAKSLLLLHHQTIKGLNKLILIGNTMFNNLTMDSVHVSFSLPTELSSGFSFNIPSSVARDVTASIHINWKVVAFANPKNIFELSFRIDNDNSNIREYRSLAYRMTVPRFDDINRKYHHQHSIIKLKEHRLENQVLRQNDYFRQFLCTLEWFQLNKEEDLFLLMTLSPLVVCKNSMLHDVNMHVTWILKNADLVTDIKESFKIKCNGGLLKLTDFTVNNSIEVNASFINDSKLLFDKPLVLTEDSLLESVNRNFDLLYNIEDASHDTTRQNLAARLSNIINHSQPEQMNQLSDDPYSILITITPWILIKNNTNLNIVLGFDRNIFLLEASNQFVPPQYSKPIKIGVTHNNEIYWSETFTIGNCILNQTESDLFADKVWRIVTTGFSTEAYLQLNIMIDKGRIIVPVTMKHTFAQKNSTYFPTIPQSTIIYNCLIIEPSVYISNQTIFPLNVTPLAISGYMSPDVDYSVIGDLDHSISVASTCRYVPVEKFFCVEDLTDKPSDKKWFLCINKLSKATPCMSLSNLVSILDFSKLSNFTENVTYTAFSFTDEPKKDCDDMDFVSLVSNSTLDFRTQRIFIDIFESRSVPIKITNHSSQQLFINRRDNTGSSGNSIICVIRPFQSVPFWPDEFLLDLNRDGCAKFNNFQFRIRIGTELVNEMDWTDYFPVGLSPELSSVDVTTVKHRQQLFVNVNSTAVTKCHIHINEQNTTLANNSVAISSNFAVLISASKVLISILESTVKLELSDESIRLTLDNVNLMHSNNRDTKHMAWELTVGDVQLDNKRYNSGQYDFPVVLYSKSGDNITKFFRCRIETDVCNAYYIDLTFEQEMELFVENILLYDMLRIFGKLSQCFIKTTQHNGAIPRYSSCPLNIGAVNISSIPLIITVHAFLKIYVSCEATSLSLPKLSLPASLMRLKTVQKKLYEHYVTAALVRCGWVMGSFELLGNPSGMLHHLTTGLSNLVCSKNIDHGLLADFMLRILSFCRYTTGGIVSSFTGIASSVSRNIDYLSMDSTHIIRQDTYRRQYQPNGVMHGFAQGMSGFALSMLGAIAGLADHPLHDTQEALRNNSSVTLAVLKGLGKGLVGVVTKPLSGTAELFAQTGRGLLRTTGISILRCHSQYDKWELNSKTELVINERNLLRHLIKLNENIPGTDRFICLWCGIATNCRQQLVLLLVTSKYLIEWHIDNPLRNDCNVYCLAEYDVVQGSATTSQWVIRLLQNETTKIGKTHLNSECRISAFLSEQVCADISDINAPQPPVTLVYPVNSNSCSSSLDSMEYLTVPTNNGCCNPRIILFTMDYPPDGLGNALTFLRLFRDNSATERIF